MMLIRWQTDNDVTDTEMLQMLLENSQRIAKYFLRAERHPDDPDRKADEE